MFSLIVVLISIALVAALSLATLYYGGSSFAQGADKALAAQIVNESQQISGAMTIRSTATGTELTTLQTLVDEQYLSQVPPDWVLLDGYVGRAAPSADACLAANQKLGVNAVPTWDEYQANPNWSGKALCITYSAN